MTSAIISSAHGGPGAAAAVGVGLLVAPAAVVRLPALIARHSVPPEGAVADISGACGELAAAGFRFHEEVVVQGAGYQAGVGRRSEAAEEDGVIRRMRHHSHGGEGHHQQNLPRSESHHCISET